MQIFRERSSAYRHWSLNLESCGVNAYRIHPGLVPTTSWTISPPGYGDTWGEGGNWLMGKLANCCLLGALKTYSTVKSASFLSGWSSVEDLVGSLCPSVYDTGPL